MENMNESSRDREERMKALTCRVPERKERRGEEEVIIEPRKYLQKQWMRIF